MNASTPQIAPSNPLPHAVTAYFERSVPGPMISVLDGAMSWLVARVKGHWGAAWGAHLQLRNADRKQPSLQLYLGNESPLSVDFVGGGFRCRSDPGTTRPAPPAFFRRRGNRGARGTILTADQLAAKRPQIEAWLDRVTAKLNPAFSKGEGRLHSGFVRRYGLAHRATDPLLVLDTESVVGFRAGPLGPGTLEKKAFQAGVERAGILWHNELDVLALGLDGRLQLIELKAGVDGLNAAAQQLLCYLRLFDAARCRGALDPPAIERMVEQRVRAGLLSTKPYPVPTRGPLVPVIALPDESAQWHERWRSVLAPTIRRHSVALQGLWLLRLDHDGTILDRRPA